MPNLSSDTIVELFNQQVETHPQAPAFRIKKPDGSWATRSWADYGAEVRALSQSLALHGIQAGNNVAILSENRPEYFIADLALLTLRAVPVPIYYTSSAAQVRQILSHAESVGIFCENPTQLAKVQQVRGELPRLRFLAGFTDSAAENNEADFSHEQEQAQDHTHTGEGPSRVETPQAPNEQALPDVFADTVFYKDLVDKGRRLDKDNPSAYATVCKEVSPEDLASIIYTSGTTGDPKGVMLTQAGIIWMTNSGIQRTGIGSRGVPYRVLSYLPLAHVMARGIDHYATIRYGGEIWFGGGVPSLREDIVACKPTLFTAPPRVYEKFEAAIVEHCNELGFPQKSLVQAAIANGQRIVEAYAQNTSPSLHDKLLRPLYNKLVLAKVRRQLGLDQTGPDIYTGSAPIAHETLCFFYALGLPLKNTYGMSETSLAMTMHPHDTQSGTQHGTKFDSVGTAVPGGELRISDEGEILYQGENVFSGYWKNPNATADSLVNGWLHTGDLGKLDEDGFLTITGRKKDLIITAGGHNISPQDIETSLTADKHIDQAVVTGDGRKYLSALITIDRKTIIQSAAHQGIDISNIPAEELSSHPEVKKFVQEAVDNANSRVARSEQIKRFKILPKPFSIENQLLTPTLKTKRAAIQTHFADLIDTIYQ